MSKSKKASAERVRLKHEGQLSELIKPDKKAMKKAISLIFGDSTFTAKALSENTKERQSSKFFHGKLSEIQNEIIAANLAGMQIGVLPQKADGHGTRAKNVREVLAVHADIDYGYVKGNLLSLAYPPHIITETSPGRAQVVWLVKACTVEDFPEVQRAVNETVGGDTSRSNVASLIRLPGTIHNKGEPFVTRIVHFDRKAKRVAVNKLLKALGPAVELIRNEVVEATASSNAKTIERIRSALASLSPGALDARDVWIKIMMAVHSEMPNESGYRLYEAASRKSPKFDEKEQKRAWKSLKSNGKVTVATLYQLAMQNGWVNLESSSSELPTSEFSLVDYFSQHLRENLIYDSSAKCWLFFDGFGYVADEYKPQELARKLLEWSIIQARHTGQTDALNFLNKHANPNSMRTLLSNCAGHAAISTPHEVFNAKPELFVAANGTIDLRAGKVRISEKSDYLSFRSDVEFDPDAKAALFLKFLKNATGGDKQFQQYLKVLIGYFLIGHNNNQILPVWKGRGGTGKGVLFRILRALLGKYAVAVSPNLLTGAYSGNPNAPSPAVMALDGPRLLICSEGTERRLDAAFVKQLSGQDELVARSPYGGIVTFSPVGTLCLSTNVLPHIDDTDDSMWRRLIIIPFDRPVDEKDRDERLTEKLLTELPGILTWAVAGAKQYLESGFPPCEAVDKVTAKARRNGDTVGSWLGACCTLSDGSKTPSSDAYASYAKHCKRMGQTSLSAPKLLETLLAKGFTHKKTNRRNLYLGFILRD